VSSVISIYSHATPHLLESCSADLPYEWTIPGALSVFISVCKGLLISPFEVEILYFLECQALRSYKSLPPPTHPKVTPFPSTFLFPVGFFSLVTGSEYVAQLASNSWALAVL
jgi:hypothetical protein